MADSGQPIRLLNTIGGDGVALLRRLRTAAAQARPGNWAPYSGFEVLAAVVTTDGRVYAGSNIENANLTLTKHAEEVAAIRAVADGALDRCGRQCIAAVYVACASSGAPCGGCRQFLAEFAAADCVWVGENTADGVVQARRFAELLPLAFGPGDLGA